jgi:ethanolamine kinase
MYANNDNFQLVFAHCDLLSGNVIIHPRGASEPPTDGAETVSFIDYEYATPCPAAFDLANHFAEWGGFDCDYNMLPTISTRQEFLAEYLKSAHQHCGDVAAPDEFDILFDEVNRFRGIPGFYWGIWALIQATISQIDFDYASYAEVRLGEYWAWREESDGVRPKDKEMPLRERRWAQEA